jgi:hypothetical protein
MHPVLKKYKIPFSRFSLYKQFVNLKSGDKETDVGKAHSEMSPVRGYA